MLCPSCGADAGEDSKYCASCGSTVVRAAEADDCIGKTIAGKFRIEKMLGEGGMGRVYLAKQLALDKPVVLKLLRQTLLSDEQTVARFQREARAASRLNHANSINIIDFGQAEDGALYIAMEYVAGKDLHQIVTRQWPLPESRIMRIMGQVLSALADAHNAGVIHRDLKPENIMVEQRRGEPDFVKVLDFGIAKIQDARGGDEPALTQAGFVCGTPEYMSPEQARGGSLDARSDLYAVGVILYQLATGLLPFDSDSAVGFATKHLSEQPLSPSRRRPEAKISPAMEQLILKAMAKDPNLRPQSAEAFREELLAIEGWRPSSPSRKTVPLALSPTLGPHISPRPGGSSAAIQRGRSRKVPTAVLLSVLCALGVGYFFWREASPQSQQLYAVDIPQARRDPEGAKALAHQGDEAHHRGELGAAATKYLAAFQKNPTAELSLKLGEVFFQLGQIPMARNWWRRHLQDDGQSKARRYIEQALGEAVDGKD